MVVLKVEKLSKTYGEGETAVEALKDADLSVNQGEFVAVVGSSGSGKSTLLHLLGGLDKANAGTVNIRGKEIFDLSDEEVTILRRRNIGFVFQDYNLVPILNVYENIVLPIELDGCEIDKSYVNELIDHLGISEKKERMPDHLSGGQRQRVAIARALAARPAIVLADEPTGNLDTRTGHEVVALLKSTAKRFNQTIIMITHNLEISRMADRVIRIEDGFICQGESYAG